LMLRRLRPFCWSAHREEQNESKNKEEKDLHKIFVSLVRRTVKSTVRFQ
jgi:hypothetical protein